MAVMSANHSIRSPYVAGQFYPAGKEELSRQIDGYLSAGDTDRQSNSLIRALIVPHAGYVYSGAVAGRGFSLLKENSSRYKRIFIIGANHNERARGFRFSVLKENYHATPLGKVKISDLSRQLVEKYPDMFQHQQLAYQSHIVEVQLPFLQKVLEEDSFEIVPIISGEVSVKDLFFLSAMLQEYSDDETLIIITADLSHYHPYKTAVELDASCTDAIIALDKEKLLKNETCGLPVIWSLLDMAKHRGWKAELIEYKNSGDTVGASGKDAVVGYASLAFWETVK